MSDQIPFSVKKLIFLKQFKQEYNIYTSSFEQALENQIDFFTIEQPELKKLEKFVEPKFIEEKFFGEFPNLEEYWPPRCFGDATKTFDENSLIKYKIEPFTYSRVE